MNRHSHTTLSIVIPAFNEQDRLPTTLGRIYNYLSEKPFSCEVIVVDDGSTDETVRRAERFFEHQQAARGLVVQNGTNCGKGFSVKRGVLHARGAYILFCDADLSTPIEEGEKLLRALIDGGCDIAIASRAHPESRIHVFQPWYRQMMGQTFNRLVQVLAVPGIKDTQCGFKCFTKSAAMRIFPQQRLVGFGFDVEVLYIAKKAGLRISECPVSWTNSSDSRVRVVKDSLRMFLDLWCIRWNDLMGRYDATVLQKQLVRQRSEDHGVV